MSFLENMLSSASDKASVKINDPAWVDKLVTRGRAQADKLPPSLKSAAIEALNETEQAKAHIAKGSGFLFTSFVSQIALGRVTDAELLWLRETATVSERRAADNAASDATRQEKRERDESIAAAKALAAKWLKILGSAAVPFLLSLL